MTTNQLDEAVAQLSDIVESFELFTPDADLDGALEGLQEVAAKLGRSVPLCDRWVDEHRPLVKPSNPQLTKNEDPFPPLVLLPALTDECEPQIGRDQCHLFTVAIEAAHSRATEAYRAYEESNDPEAFSRYEALRRSAVANFHRWVRGCCPDEQLIRDVARYLASPADDHSGHHH